MAKTHKFSDDELLGAVVKYAEVYKGKIKASQLAAWTSANIDGLQDVRDYHFTRPYTDKDPKTGKKISRIKPCTERINEINAARSNAGRMDRNPLLQSSDVNAFLELPRHEQTDWIIQTRQQVDELIKSNAFLRMENRSITAALKEQDQKRADYTKLAEKINQQQAKLIAMMKDVIDSIDENNQREMLSKIGINSGSISLEQFVNNLTEDVKQAVSLDDIIAEHQTQLKRLPIEDMMGGIDF